MVALDDTFTESARVKTNDPSTRGTTEEFEPPFMKETKHTNYIFNQGMESGSIIPANLLPITKSFPFFKAFKNVGISLKS